MAGLTIGELATSTGVAAATLRAWESRHGFPSPRRQSGGHRRYDEADVPRIAQVVRLREEGLSLDAAVRRVRAVDRRQHASIFAGIRQDHPRLAPTTLTKTTLLALTRAIEDECCARAVRPQLFGAFQHERYLDRSRDRWRELARTAEQTVVFAQPAERRTADPGDPMVVDIPPGAPLRREWAVVCESEDYPACLAAWELPGQEAVPDAHRLFESIWSLEPEVVRHAASVCAVLARELCTDIELAEVSTEPAAPASADLVRATSLLQRMTGYLDSHVARSA